MDNYYKDNQGNVYAFDDLQVAMGLAGDKTPMTPEEVEAHVNPPKTDTELRNEWKALREDLVANIRVTTKAGNVFDGDETSQGRMARAVTSMDDTDTVTWVLADNSVISATRAELKEALKLAGAAQAAVWVAK